VNVVLSFALLLLVSNGAVVRKRSSACAVLWFCLELIPEKREARGLRVLDFVSFREPSASLTPCSYRTVGNLAYNDSNQLAIAKAGAIPALVSLIIKSTPTAMERAISALGNLAFNDVNRKAIPKAGAIAPLVFLLTEGNQVMQEQSALALGEC
jgi:hypothetical protein